jgi:hypothetical protein
MVPAAKRPACQHMTVLGVGKYIVTRHTADSLSSKHSMLAARPPAHQFNAPCVVLPHLAGCWADTSCELREVVGLQQPVQSLPPATLVDQIVELRDLVACTAHRAPRQHDNVISNVVSKIQQKLQLTTYSGQSCPLLRNTISMRADKPPLHICTSRSNCAL